MLQTGKFIKINMGIIITAKLFINPSTLIERFEALLILLIKFEDVLYSPLPCLLSECCSEAVVPGNIHV